MGKHLREEKKESCQAGVSVDRSTEAGTSTPDTRAKGDKPMWLECRWGVRMHLLIVSPIHSLINVY